MAKEKDKELYEDLISSFIKDFCSLVDDFYDVSVYKSKNIGKYKSQISETESPVSKDKLIKEFIDENHSHLQFRRAMFNYMNSTFERHINKLLEASILANKPIKERVLNKFIELDASLIRKNEKSLRNSAWESASQVNKNRILINHLNEIIQFSQLPPLLAWKLFFDVEDNQMWSDKNLRLDFTEIRARRNLLTHRGVAYDKKYIEDILVTTKSKNVNDPKKRFEEYFENRYFTSQDLKAKEKPEIQVLMNKGVFISNQYFFHAFSVFSRVYFILCSQVLKSDYFIHKMTHDLLNTARSTHNPAFVFLASRMCSHYLKHDYCDKDSNTYFKANYLLMRKELREIYKINQKEFEEKVIDKEFYNEIKKEKDPIFNVLINVLDSKLELALKNLGKCCGLPSLSESWFMFVDLKKEKGFIELMDKICDSPQK